MKCTSPCAAAVRGVAFFGAGLALALAGAANAVPVNPNLPGNTAYDEWVNMTAAGFPGISGSFPGATAWTGPAGSNAAGSGDAALNKVSGNAFFGSQSLYAGGFLGDPNLSGAVLRVSESTPLAGVQTIVFQVEIGEAFGYDFFNDVTPVLSYNGGSQGLAATTAAILSTIQNGTFTNPITMQEEPLLVNTWMLTWDVSSLGALTDFSLQWTDVMHSQVYGLRLDQSDVAVPEPGTLLLLVSGLFGLGTLGRRRAA